MGRGARVDTVLVRGPIGPQDSVAETANLVVALSAIAIHDDSMEVVDPFQELSENKLREVVEHCIEWGRTSIGYHGGDDRMAERRITGGQILAALRGVLKTSSCVAGRWRYSGRRHGIEVIFAFDVDDEGTSSSSLPS